MLLFSNSLDLAILCVREASHINFQSQVFSDNGEDSFIGFHDWLRRGKASSEIVGVRLTPTDPTCFEKLDLNRSYISRSSNGEGIEVFFSQERKYDTAISDDQSFRLNKLMISSKGHGALVLDIAALSPKEKVSLEQMVTSEAHEVEAGWAEPGKGLDDRGMP